MLEPLDEVFHDPELRDLQAEDFNGDYGVVRYLPPEHDFEIDLLSHIGEMFAYEDLAWVEREFLGVPVRVADPATLFRMKRATMRDRDHLDAARLKEKFGLGED